MCGTHCLGELLLRSVKGMKRYAFLHMMDDMVDGNVEAIKVLISDSCYHYDSGGKWEDRDGRNDCCGDID